MNDHDTRTRRRVLLVDDNAEACRALAKYLEFSGFAVTQAADGAAALRALEDGPPFDFVLTDLMLPDIDGCEVARRARLLSPPPRTALITGWSVELDPEASRDLDWVFYKPLDSRALVAKLQAATPDAGPG